MMKGLTIALLLAGASLAADVDEIAFEENTCVEQQPCQERPCGHMRCHYRLREPNVEEEHLWHERTDSSWAGKRDDNFIDTMLHQHDHF